MFDILIKNGRIIDGSGSAWFKGDVAIKNERVVAVEPKIEEAAKKTIDAKGLIVSPGFIDAHSHSDFPVLINPKAESKIRMGVTTEVIGQCGTSAAPRNTKETEFFFGKLEGLDIDFTTMDEYLSLLDNKGMAVNIVALFGHGTIRGQVVGFEDRPATQEEMKEMKELVAQAMRDGAFGMTTGLIYPPSCYAPLEEIIELAKVVAEYGGIYASHMRNERDRLHDSIKETIEIGRQAGLPVHISHYKACGEENWGLGREGLELIEQARAEGIDITMDQYPYIATSTSLKTLVPKWAHDGGTEALRQRLLDPETKQEIRRQMCEGDNRFVKRFDWVIVASCEKAENKKYEGKNLVEISEMMGKEPVDATFDLLLDENFTPGMVRFAMCEEDVEYNMKHPLVMIGSDASCMATTGPLSLGKPHPRAYGTFARILGHYVHERKIMPLEEAIRKMTGYPATRFRLWNRGFIRPGYYADITIFDEDTVRDTATFVNPHSYATGISHVIVNGKLVLENGKQFDVFPGRALRNSQ